MIAGRDQLHVKADFQSFPDLLKFFCLTLLQAKLCIRKKISSKYFTLFLFFMTTTLFDTPLSSERPRSYVQHPINTGIFASERSRAALKGKVWLQSDFGGPRGTVMRLNLKVEISLSLHIGRVLILVSLNSIFLD